MGHVDHGKTTLLDKLRSASVAASEAGGITQHVGAFSVEVKGMTTGSEGKRAITFLDTPGHAAFTQMRSRGAKVTDIVVLVVAADDGVMPQTKEVIQMVRDAQEEEGGTSRKGNALQLVVAISKMDLPDANSAKVKGQLTGENVILEELGGDVPCIELSGKTGEGLDSLQETLVALSELNEIRAEREGPMEGYVIESRLQRGFGNTAIVLVKRGTARVGDYCVAGTSWCKVRRLTDGSASIDIESAKPGEAVLITGWRDLPRAGDMVLGVEASAEGVAAEELAKKCIETRKRVEEDRRLLRDVEAINEGRREDAEARAKINKVESEVRRLQREARMKGQQQQFDRQAAELSVRAAQEALESSAPDADRAKSDTQKAHELRLIVKADVSGTVEAVVGAISGIGNSEVGVKIVSASVGDPSEGDFDLAQAVQGHILGFNVKADKAMMNAAERSVPPIMIHCDDVIYRLMSFVTEQCSALLPPLQEVRIAGEASVQQVFSINLKGKQTRNVAGCRVTNGSISRNHTVRVLRTAKSKSSDRREKAEENPKNAQYDNAGRLIVFDGKLDSLKQVKKEVDEMRKGAECGISFADNFQDIREGDLIQSYYIEKVARTL
jgi:translation initiation factor IF-2